MYTTFKGFDVTMETVVSRRSGSTNAPALIMGGNRFKTKRTNTSVACETPSKCVSEFEVEVQPLQFGLRHPLLVQFVSPLRCLNGSYTDN